VIDFVVPNERSKDYILNLLNKELKIGFLPNTINEEFFDVNKVASSAELRVKYNIPNNNICIVLVSTLSIRKGVLEFLRAYSKLDSAYRDEISLIFLGEGDLMNDMVELKKLEKLDKVHLLGYVEMETVREFLKLSDMFALPTKLDPNPLTPIEASFMKKPLMLSKYAGNFNELLNKKTGIPINEITVNEIEKRLLQLMTYSREDLKLMGEEAYKNVQTNFTRKEAAVNLIEFFRNSI